MPEDRFQERTEPASPRRREEARQKGQVARSQEVATTAILAASLLTLAALGPGMLERLATVVRRFLLAGSSHIPLNSDMVPTLAAILTEDVATIVLPLALVLTGVGIAANIAQVGVLFSLQPLTPNLGRLNPIAGVKRLFEIKSLIELAKAIAKFAVVATAMVTWFRSLAPELLALSHVPISSVPGIVGRTILGLGWRIVAALIVLAIADYLFQRFEHFRKLRMTKEEVKEERKQSEGDDRTRARVRARQLELTRNRMLAAVPKADVVVTNPIHVAVALQYDPDNMRAPRVVAKGARLLAERIQSIARQNRIPVVQNPPLARLLYKTVRVGREVPEQLYRAVAEIMARVFRARRLDDHARATRAAGAIRPMPASTL